jgi:hypothetical protein
MLEASVQMSLLTERDNLIEVGVVEVGVDTEKTLEDSLDNGLEVFGEGNLGKKEI